MKCIIALCLSVFLVGDLFAQKGIRESCAPTAPIVVDGNPDEWGTEWMLDPDGKFLFNVCNDTDNLFIRIKISDDLTQRKIALFGMYVKLDVNGKKKGKLGLKYPVGKDANELKQEQPPFPQDAAGRAMAKKQLLTEVEVLELLGLAKENIVSSRLGLMNGIEVLMVANDEGHYVYESKIPFKAFRIDKTKVPILGVTIETGKMSPPKTPAAPQSAGRQGGFTPNNYGQYSPMMVQEYMWAGVKLK
ncbi:MAG: hypothetical protein ACKVOQ_03675 [Cyclobacteriaceae bacterium]